MVLRYIYSSNRIASVIVLGKNQLITSSNTGELSLWEIDSLKLLGKIILHSSEITSLCVSHDNKYLFSIGYDYKLCISELRQNEIIKRKTMDGCFTHIAAHPWETQIVVVLHIQDIDYIQLIDYSNIKVIYSIPIKESEIKSVVFNHSGEYIAIGKGNGDILIMRTDSGEVINKLTEHKKGISALSFLPSKNILISGSEDRTIRVWDIKRQTSLRILEGHESTINFLSFEETGNFLISCGNDGNIATWNITRGVILNSFHQPYFSKGIYAKYIKTRSQIIYVAGELVFFWRYPSLEEEINIAKSRNEGRVLSSKDREQFFLD